MGGSVEKSPIKDMAKKLSNLSQSVFALENPTHWGLETAVCPIFLKPYLDVFAVFLLLPKINLSHTHTGYLCPKNQYYLLGKADLKFFLSYRFRTIIEIKMFSTSYITDNLLSCYSQNLCKKYRLFP